MYIYIYIYSLCARFRAEPRLACGHAWALHPVAIPKLVFSASADPVPRRRISGTPPSASGDLGPLMKRHKVCFLESGPGSSRSPWREAAAGLIMIVVVIIVIIIIIVILIIVRIVNSNIVVIVMKRFEGRGADRAGEKDLILESSKSMPVLSQPVLSQPALRRAKGASRAWEQCGVLFVFQPSVSGTSCSGLVQVSSTAHSPLSPHEREESFDPLTSSKK